MSAQHRRKRSLSGASCCFVAVGRRFFLTVSVIVVVAILSLQGSTASAHEKTDATTNESIDELMVTCEILASPTRRNGPPLQWRPKLPSSGYAGRRKLGEQQPASLSLSRRQHYLHPPTNPANPPWPLCVRQHGLSPPSDPSPPRPKHQSCSKSICDDSLPTRIRRDGGELASDGRY